MSIAIDRDQYTKPLIAYYHARVAGSPETARLESVAIAANIKIAKAFARANCGTTAIDDVEAAAMLGLVEAIRRWSPDGAANLSTFARGWMAANVQEAKAATWVVRVPRATLRAATAIRASGEDVADACARLNKQTGPIMAALGVRSCELSPEVGPLASFEDDLLEDEGIDVLADVAALWRGTDALARIACASESLAQRAKELRAKPGPERAATAVRALASTLWPADPQERLQVVARLDYALVVAASERETDVECWRRFYVEGESWVRIGAALGGVSRTRAQFRARRAEPAIARALAEALTIPPRALELWARRPANVRALERLGLVDASTDPLAILYLVEDLEVAVTEIDPAHARVWTAQRDGKSWAEIASIERIGRKTARAWAGRADQSLLVLLQSSEPVRQLELQLAVVTSTWIVTSYFSPNSLVRIDLASWTRAARQRHHVSRIAAGTSRGAAGNPAGDPSGPAQEQTSSVSNTCTGPPATADPNLDAVPLAA